MYVVKIYSHIFRKTLCSSTCYKWLYGSPRTLAVLTVGLIMICYKQSAATLSVVSYYSPHLQSLLKDGDVAYCQLNCPTCCCEYQLVLSGEECCHGDCCHFFVCKYKDHVQTRLSLMIWKGFELPITVSEMCWNHMTTITMETCSVPIDRSCGTLLP